MAGKRYKHPDTLKDRRPERMLPTPGEIGERRAEAAVPAPPSGLLAHTREYWREAWLSEPGRLIRMVDRGALDRYIKSLDEWARAYRDLAAVRRSALRPRPAPCTCQAAEGEDHAPLCASVQPFDRGQAIADFYFTAKPIHSRIARLDQICHTYEQAFGLNPLARMRLNIDLAKGLSAFDELARSVLGPDEAQAAAEEAIPYVDVEVE